MVTVLQALAKRICDETALLEEKEANVQGAPQVIKMPIEKVAYQQPYLLASFNFISLTLLAESFRFCWICKASDQC